MVCNMRDYYRLSKRLVVLSSILIVYSSSLNILRLNRHAVTNRYSISLIPEYNVIMTDIKKKDTYWITKNWLSIEFSSSEFDSRKVNEFLSESKKILRVCNLWLTALISSKHRIDFSQEKLHDWTDEMFGNFTLACR